MTPTTPTSLMRRNVGLCQRMSKRCDGGESHGVEKGAASRDEQIRVLREKQTTGNDRQLLSVV